MRQAAREWPSANVVSASPTHVTCRSRLALIGRLKGLTELFNS